LSLAAALAAVPASAFEVAEGLTLPMRIVTSVLSNQEKKTLFNREGELMEIDPYEFEASVQLTPKYRTKYFSLLADGWFSYHTPSETLEVQNEFSATTSIISEAVLEIMPHDAVVIGGGKSHLRWGPGYYWNPSQPFSDFRENGTDRLQPYKSKGRDVAYFEWTLKAFNLGLFYQKGPAIEEIRSNTYDDIYSTLLRSQIFLDGIDFAIIFGNLDNSNFSAASFSAAISNNTELHAEVASHSGKLKLVPVATAVQTERGPENIYNFRPSGPEHPYTDLLAGGQYTFENNTNIVLEYIFNGSGYTQEEFDLLMEQALKADSENSDPALRPAHAAFLRECSYMMQSMMRQHYLFMRIKFDDLPLGSSLNFHSRVALEDGSFVVGGGIKISLFQNAEAGIDGEYFEGHDQSEAGLIPYRANVISGLAVKF
jgi:hypothetical protein